MAIWGLIEGVTSREFSHNRGYAKAWEDILDDVLLYSDEDIQDDKIVYLYLGINYSGSLNLFGGASEKLFNRLNHFLNVDNKMIVLDFDMPDLGKMLQGRLGNKTTYEGFTQEFLDKLSKKCQGISTLTMQDLITDKLCMGDSHSLSVRPVDHKLIRKDGKTLFGFVKELKDNSSELNEFLPNLKQLTLMFGSIDIRHHLMRQSEPGNSLKALVTDYLTELSKIKEKYPDLTITLHGPVPVESESRKLPKTGFYKGTPFYGSREERMELTDILREELSNSGFNYIEFPTIWYQMDPVVYEKTIMERPKSVHVGYPFYSINNYGINNYGIKNEGLDEW